MKHCYELMIDVIGIRELLHFGGIHRDIADKRFVVLENRNRNGEREESRETNSYGDGFNVKRRRRLHSKQE